MLANAPGFLSLYNAREVQFEEIYPDLIQKAFLPKLRGRIEEPRASLLKAIERVISGKVLIKQEYFFLKNKQGELEFSLLAEGMRKLGLIWLLIQNGTLKERSTLFWDEPEANLNPEMHEMVIDVIMQLQRLGVQVFIASHDDHLLKTLDVMREEEEKNRIAFFSLHRDEEGEIACNRFDNYVDIEPNPIEQAYSVLLDRKIDKIAGTTQ